jgi:hypothetical protein
MSSLLAAVVLAVVVTPRPVIVPRVYVPPPRVVTPRVIVPHRVSPQRWVVTPRVIVPHRVSPPPRVVTPPTIVTHPWLFHSNGAPRATVEREEQESGSATPIAILLSVIGVVIVGAVLWLLVEGRKYDNLR